jgi:hypothetical protein
MNAMRSLVKGSTLLEFTLVGVPMIFLLISIVEMARGMWIYTTLGHAIAVGTRYAITRGPGYTTTCTAASGNGCQLTVQMVAQEINGASPGLIANQMINVVIGPVGGTVACGNLSSCLGDTTALNLTRGQQFSVTAQYQFTSAISMFWPGRNKGMQMGSFNLPATAQEVIQF